MILTACGSPQPAGTHAEEPAQRPDETIAEIIRADPELSILADALEASNLIELLSKEQEPYTLFAPTNGAFAALPEGQLTQWLRDPLDIREVMLYHIVPATFSADDMVQMGLLGVATFEGAQVAVHTEVNPIQIDQAAIIRADVWARNGAIHIVDAVLRPPGY